MTKHTDSSRSTDSGVSGNAQTNARGSRESAHKFARQLIGTDDCVWKIQDGFKYLDESELAELIEAYAESECSRLASRVERLEKGLRNVLATHVYWPEGLPCPGTCPHQGCTMKRNAMALLAGAHAEEKE